MTTPPAAADFDALVAPHRQELHRYCYRILGSLADADEALQDALLDAFRGLAGFDGRGTARAWLFRIATRACIHVAERRPKRVTAPELGPPSGEVDASSRDPDACWLDPYPTDPSWRFEELEAIELAYVSALQTLPPRQRATLILCDVVGLSAEESAEALGTSVPAVNSALQRAHAVPGRTQQATLRDVGSAREAELVRAFMSAWERSDVDALVALMAEDARFTMPPLRTWLEGRDAIGAFIRQCAQHPRKVAPTRANGQLAFVFRHGPASEVELLHVLTLGDQGIREMTAFLDPAVHGRFLAEHR